MANSQPSNNMPLNAFGDPVEQEVNAFGDPVEEHSSKIQKLNRTELGKLPQFQPEQVSMLDKLAGPISDYVVAPIANIPNAIRGVAAEGMNLPFRAARAMGLYPESQQRMQISPDQFDTNGNVVPGSISQSNVPVPLPYNANYAPQIPFTPTPMQPTQPEGQALLNKVLGMATPDVALGAPLVGPRATAAFFAPQMVAQVPQMLQHGAEQVMNPALSGREKVGAAGTTLADLLMAAAVTHGAMPETPQPSGLTRADVPGYTWEDVRRFQMPNKPGIEMPDVEQPKTFETPIIGQRPLDIGQKIVTSENTPSTVIPQTSAVKPEPLGGQVSFNSPANANAIPNALQQAQPSLAQMLEDAIKKNQIEREQNASQIRSNEESLPGTPGQERQAQIQQGASGALRSGDLQPTAEAGTGGNGSGLRIPSGGREGIDDLTRSEEGGKTYEGQTGKTSTPTTSDFEKYSELRQQAKEFSAKGEFPPSELLRQMEEIKNRNKGMPPKEETTVPLNETLIPKTGGIGTGMKKAIEGNQEAGSVSLEPFKDFAENTKKIAQGLSVDFQVMRDMFLRKEEFRHIVAKNMGIEGGATTTANRARNSVELEATRIFGKDKSDLALNGVIAALSAEGDKSKLALFATQAAKNKEAMEGIRFAQANWNKLQPLVKQLADLDTFNRAEAKKSGVSIPYLHDYLKRMYESDRGWLTRGTGSSGMGAGSKLPRQFDTVYHAIQFGKKPILDAAEMIGKRTGEIFNEVNEHLWSEHLKSFPDSRTGEMVMTEPVRKGKVLTAPEGYTNVQLPSGKTVSVLEGYDKLIKAITGESLVNNSVMLSSLRNFGQEMKHGTLAFDTYHMAKVVMYEQSLGVRLGSHKKGLAILEYSNSDLNEALKQGLITKEAVDYSRGTENTSHGPMARREISSVLIRNGLGVGKHSEALYDSFARSIPGIGQAHKFIFDELTRGAMIEVGVKEFTRQSKNHPTMSKDQVAQMVARDVNFRMGNIGKQGIFKSATMQDLLSIPFLAPKWVEAIAQSEGRSIGQIGKAMLPGKDFMKPGTLGKSSAALVMTFVAATQVLNMLSTGHPTWKNPKGHQLDLFVPPITKNGKGMWISPLSVAAELTHDMVRLTNNKGNAPDATARIAVNKLSGTGRGLYTYITGKNWKGEELHGWNRVEAAIGAMFNPLPLPIQQTTESIKAADYTPAEKQGFAMVGVKGEIESYNEQKQRIIDNMKSGKGMTLFERKQLEEQLKSLRQTPSDAAKVAITTRATEQMLERKNGLRDELPDDIKSWLKHENLDITGFDNAFSYRKTRIGLTQDEADRYKEIVKDAYVQFLSAHVGQQMTQQKLDGVLIKAKNYARKQMKGEMQTN